MEWYNLAPSCSVRYAAFFCSIRKNMNKRSEFRYFIRTVVVAGSAGRCLSHKRRAGSQNIFISQCCTDAGKRQMWRPCVYTVGMRTSGIGYASSTTDFHISRYVSVRKGTYGCFRQLCPNAKTCRTKNVLINLPMTKRTILLKTSNLPYIHHVTALEGNCIFPL